ncbi:hypothetical protein ASD64_16890 [Mesorhizobium sp. Root157]|uniref:hypothetical protein n=1 Tax=Mesorhizobium sp. Root157 TaxID=1736477 RepID=UPI0006FBB5DA|nr:hypothetical protein [Mesorhizobium sp. Root157]KQZ96496.1 hypothetical protein ASD64_16890 [Mesorhizobium sp. Root157]
MRLLFLLILFAGLGTGFIYPWSISNFSGREIGIWPVYRQGRFEPVDVQLTSSDAPVRVLVDVITNANDPMPSDGAVLTVTASHGGRTVLAETLRFAGNLEAREKSPQIAEKISRDDAGLIDPVSDGAYSFVIGPGDAEGPRIKEVELILRSGAGEVDPRLQPIGISLTAIGFIGFVLTFGRSRSDRSQNPNSQPPPPRWGRGGGTDGK